MMENVDIFTEARTFRQHSQEACQLCGLFFAQPDQALCEPCSIEENENE